MAVRTEEEQQAAAREREEKERAQIEKDNNERREARRKSLANRRVSFAAEATLHTFHEIEVPQDSTTSTDTTRRASSSTAAPSPAPPALEAPKPPSSPDNTEDDTLAYDSDLEHADSVAEIQAEEMTGSSDDSDVEDGTMMTVEAEEMTSASIATPRSHFSADSSSGDLDENLRLAARQAVTQRLDADEEVIVGFAGWGKKNNAQGSSSQGSGQNTRSSFTQGDQGSDMDMDADMDMTTPVGGIIRQKSSSPVGDDGDDMDMSMDVTKAIGGIIAQPISSTVQENPDRPASSLFGAPTPLGERPMELTTTAGGIRRSRASDASQFDTDALEDMSMEITTAIGGVLGGTSFGNVPQPLPLTTNTGTGANDEEDDASMMDMTVSVGQILRDRPMNEANDTQAMDMTAVGGIIKPALPPQQSSTHQTTTSSTAKENVRPLTSTAVIRTSPKRRRSAVVDENGSPGLAAFQSNSNLRQSLPPASSAVAGDLSNDAPSSPLQSSPLRSSPTRILPTRSSPDRRPLARRPSPDKAPETQLGTPVSKPAPRMIGSRSSSPVRAASPMLKTTPLSIKSKLFRQDPSTGLNTPRIVLTPQNRRLSGVGADRPGLGSPKVAEIIDKRDSIGESAPDFVPSQPDGQRRAVAFADPRVMEAELDKERREEEERENSRRILEREADGERDATVNLMEMIQSLTPKKKPLRGRKSLAVGSARGLLGKRPVELDQDVEEDTPENDGVKRLKGYQGSPVKNMRLQAPPSKEETTTGRETVSGSMDQSNINTITPTIPSSPTRATTPRNQGRFKDVANDQPTITMDFDHTGPIDENAVQQDDDGERIHLQDFLNMTSIRFMELTTTKRRHTIAPGASRDSTSAEDKDVTFESCVVAGACTVPMLELYQHVGQPHP